MNICSKLWYVRWEKKQVSVSDQSNELHSILGILFQDKMNHVFIYLFCRKHRERDEYFRFRWWYWEVKRVSTQYAEKLNQELFSILKFNKQTRAFFTFERIRTRNQYMTKESMCCFCKMDPQAYHCTCSYVDRHQASEKNWCMMIVKRSLLRV